MKINKKILFLTLLGIILLSFFAPLASVVAAGTKLCQMIYRVQSTIWSIGGSAVVIGWVIAGILYLTAGGAPDKLGLAKKALIAAIIGTILVVLSASAAAIVKSALGEGTWEECTL